MSQSHAIVGAAPNVIGARRADVSWHARVSWNRVLDVVQTELWRALMSQDQGATEAWRHFGPGWFHKIALLRDPQKKMVYTGKTYQDG